MTFAKLVNLFMNIVNGLILCGVGLTISNAMELELFIQNFVMSVGIGYFIGDWIPALDWGFKLADVLGAKEGIARHMISVLVMDVVMIGIVSFLCQFAGNGIAVFQIWPVLAPWLIGFGYIAMVICFPAALKLAARIMKED